MQKITIEQLELLMVPETHERIHELAKNATHLVLFENQDFWSSSFGKRTVLAIGPGFTYKRLKDVKGQHLHDLPSQRQYPTAYVKCNSYLRCLLRVALTPIWRNKAIEPD